ncbi:hypothetical protein A2276_02775 [candidate division WOR-1 bacterium RIFOXYA12_FULL_43_27]|uniref:Glutathione synthetase n=1 Tax=candidate division WOR-1 bacterium RIFOXYC2_FULL_46_14 TaxID=1802587 RepID=A0A1F4U7M5_UNCSA|nr:MAG: hypothetical protein A2276_02775 [candidate division WOR-1 bacterium RIFOXYA12_FULL_43_27]OGC19367.1 MAG: hypothetical protein A2292_01560 [candidate division WOR-1 bacterium RIFOXYB2_FULL_46_45]OGC30356.1 MAG: hypothetical protein A2232_01560 [candidate division WOR-1 bacterium RIFOXYA2_FULL_46_56]OGC40956.1 MAG: hypothetical protein A2438_01560 [candidate division WOR-1 bacterium RIFOXYC2_FULL_46_14]
MKLFGLAAALLTSTGFIPQIIRGFKTKKLDDVSTVMLLIIIVGTICWTIYGFYINDRIVIAANAFTCATVLLLFAMKYFYAGRG